jgi:hypothetical protein
MLESACHSAFRALGFGVTPLGRWSGKPDGLAYAAISTKESPSVPPSYLVSYDAKSTSHPKVKSDKLVLSSIARHRDENKADFAAVIGVDFETDGGEKAKAVKEARAQKVTLIRAGDLAELVKISGTKPLSLGRLRGLFKECRTPDEVRKWVAEFKDEVPSGPSNLGPMLEAIYELQQKDKLARPTFSALRYHRPEFQVFPPAQLRDAIETLARLVPALIFVYGDTVELSQRPEIVIRQIHQVLGQLPKSFTKPTV